MTTLVATRIGLEVHCADPVCTQFAHPLFEQLSEGDYEECAVLPLWSVELWRDAHRTARKRADRARRRGYYFQPIQPHLLTDDLYAINTSATHRQGRQMSAGYQTPPPTDPLPDYPCSRHGVHAYGVFSAESRLVAYSFIYRAGDLALVSQILGHADYLKDEVMYLLLEGVVDHESGPDGGLLVYNRYDSGTDGLRFFKDRCGFERTRVEWSQW